MSCGLRSAERLRCMFGRRFLSYIFLLLALSTPFVVLPLLQSFLIVEKKISKADALVLMAGSPEIRIPPLGILYKKQSFAKILLTNDGILGGWSPDHGRNLYHVEWAEQALLRQGVPAEAIVTLPFSVSGTFYDAFHAMDYATRKGMDSVMIVTSDYHTRRTLWSFEHHRQKDTIIIGMYPVPEIEAGDLTMRRLKIFAVELGKLIYYQVRYGLTAF